MARSFDVNGSMHTYLCPGNLSLVQGPWTRETSTVIAAQRCGTKHTADWSRFSLREVGVTNIILVDVKIGFDRMGTQNNGG